MAKVLQPGNIHIKKFNIPRYSKHTLIGTKWFPTERIRGENLWHPLEGLAVWQPPKQDYQLIHSFNAIPYTTKPWIVTFESFLPRTLGKGGDFLKRILRERLALDNCKKIIAMSDYARSKFIRQNKDWDLLDKVINKLEIVHPNFPVSDTVRPKLYEKDKPLQLLFIGKDFARKGGIPALRLAKKAEKLGLTVQIHLISGMHYGTKVYTDCLDATRYEEDLKLINSSNVVFHGKMPHQEVLQLLSKSHFQIMATLDDTYGFSLIEGFSVATPAITTNVCALPEIVRHGKSGYLLDLELNEYRNWVHLSHSEYRGKIYQSSEEIHEYWDVLNSTYDNLTEQALQLVINILDAPDDYEQLSAGALEQALNVYNARTTNDLLDNIYSKIVQEET